MDGGTAVATAERISRYFEAFLEMLIAERGASRNTVDSYRRDLADCAHKIRTLLAHPVKARRIREAGRARALRDHTWERRFEDAFSTVGLLAASASSKVDSRFTNARQGGADEAPEHAADYGVA